jgi:hypothetical protein
MGTASERRPMSGLLTMGRLAEAWRICSEEAATPMRICSEEAATPMPSLRKKLTPSHGKSRKPCTQNPTPITSRRRSGTLHHLLLLLHDWASYSSRCPGSNTNLDLVTSALLLPIQQDNRL